MAWWFGIAIGLGTAGVVGATLRWGLPDSVLTTWAFGNPVETFRLGVSFGGRRRGRRYSQAGRFDDVTGERQLSAGVTILARIKRGFGHLLKKAWPSTT